MANAWTRLASRLGIGADVPPELAKVFTALDAIERGLANRVRDYVVSGEGAEILARLAGASDTRILRYLGVRDRAYYANDDAEIAAVVRGWSVAASVKARDAYYASLQAPDERTIRVARVLAAARLATNEGPSPAEASGAPSWFLALVRDVFGDTAIFANARDWLQSRRAAFSMSSLRELLLLDGHREDELDRIVILAIVGRSSGAVIGRLTDVSDIVPFLRENAGLVTESVRQLPAGARDDALTLLNRLPELRESYGGMLSDMLIGASKPFRTQAASLIATLPEDRQIGVLAPLLASAPSARVSDVIDALARIPGGAGVAAAQATPIDDPARSGVVRAALVPYLSSAATEPEGAAELPALRPLAESDLGTEYVASVRAALQRAKAQLTQTLDEARAAPKTKRADSWIAAKTRDLREIDETSDRQLMAVADFLSGRTTDRPSAASVVAAHARDVRIDLLPRLRLSIGGTTVKWVHWSQILSDSPDVDLRSIADAAARLGQADAARSLAAYATGWSRMIDSCSDENVWPFFVVHPELLEEAFGLRPSPGRYDGLSIDRAFDVLERFPYLPATLVPSIVQLALGDGKRYRVRAQELLRTHGKAYSLAVHGLTDGKAELRASAADWLARLADSAAIEPLRVALKTERREVAVAAFLSSLERLGDDISGDLTPEVLLAQAQKGLKARLPAGLGWFPFDGLPAVRWAATGDAVPAEVVRWWVVLAMKLKDPGGSGLIARYLTLLEPSSAAALGVFTMRSWVVQDTRRPTDEESRQLAQAETPARFRQYREYAKKYPTYYGHYADVTEDAVFEELRAEHAATYAGSAIGEKGVLALGAAAPGAEIAALVQSYMRDHYQRRAQVESLIAMAAASDDPAAMQLVLSTARRHRTASVQAKARELVDLIAARRGWTAEQLADRTVPTAGFDDSGVLRLSFGERGFTGRITPKYTLELASDDGKVIKALPAARVGEDEAVVKEAKAQLSASRKELKQVVAAQSARLYEAMCAERAWPADEWLEFVLAHPLVGRLASDLVWFERTATGEQRLFRPSDGTLLGADDDEISLRTGSTVHLAHTVLVGSADIEAWRRHLADYAVRPLFPQFRDHQPSASPDGATLTDRRGWLSDTFTIRGLATKRGFQRSQSEDGGWFDTYRKSYPSLGIEAVIEFTGSYLPEENLPAAVTDLRFERLTGRRAALELVDVPAVLLRESYCDYVAVADAGSFDPDWQRKAAW